MRCIPGFMGFNEREYDAERMQTLVVRANRNDQAALERFPTMGAWRDQISAVLGEFANDTQYGKMLERLSPAAAWAAEIPHRPLKQLPEEARYILSTHQKRVTVRQEGIVMTIRGKRLLYYNEHTGPLIGQEILAFYNLEMPELLTVCDVKRQNYFSVGRVELPAMSATKEQLEEVNRLRKGHMAHAKGIFGDIPHDVISTVTRDNDHSEEDKELGRFHNQETERVRTEQTETVRAIKRVRQKAAAAGFDPNRIRIKNPKRVEEALERIARRTALRRKEAEGIETQGAQ
jgi:hypothetical protein